MVPHLEAEPEQRLLRQRPPLVLALGREFHELTGFALSCASVRGLPAAFLDAPAPSPGAVLAGLALSPRALNVLRRHTAAHDDVGPWTYRRLTEIPGLGLKILLEILRAPPLGPRLVPHRIEDLSALKRWSEPGQQPSTDFLERVAAVIAPALPASEAELGRLLGERGLASGPVDLARLERVLRPRPALCPFAVLRRTGLSLVVPRPRLAAAQLVHGRAVRALLARGVGSVARVALEVEGADLDLARAVVSATVRFEWLDPARLWFWTAPSTGPLVTILVRLLLQARTLPLEELERAAFRAWPAEAIPPSPVTLELCRRCSRFVVRGSRISLAPGSRPVPPSAGRTG